MTTLRKALTQAKCSVPSKIKPRNTTGPDWPNLLDIVTDLPRISIWEEFTLENLNASYGHILDRQIPEGELNVPTANAALATIEVKQPRDINHLIHWSDGVLGPTLDFARSKLGLERGTALRREVASPEATGSRPSLYRDKNKRRIHLDHLVQLDHYKMPTLVAGLGRPSRSFPARDMANGGKTAIECSWPLRQLANICFYGRTRFGYILTDEDLLVCCFYAINPASPSSKWSAAVMPVAWSKAGPEQLTTDLALWWLSMLAISGSHHRRITPLEDMTRIDAWEVDRHADGQNWVRRHKYSKYEEPTDEPTPPAYEPPSPGNVEGMAAAFNAAVGINADLDFDLFPGVAGAGANDDLDQFDFNAFVGQNFY